MTDIYNDYSLQKECESLAEMVLDEHKDNISIGEEIDEFDDSLSDRVTEVCDGHEYVIYHYKALRFCSDADVSNGEEFLEEVGMPETPTIQGLASTILYGEMQYRVTMALQDLIREHNESIED